MAQLAPIEIGYQVYLKDGGEEVGAVRALGHGRKEITVYIENAGDFTVSLDAVRAVHSQKVILDPTKLSRELRRAVGHAHDAEQPGE